MYKKILRVIPKRFLHKLYLRNSEDYRKTFSFFTETDADDMEALSQEKAVEAVNALAENVSYMSFLEENQFNQEVSSYNDFMALPESDAVNFVGKYEKPDIKPATPTSIQNARFFMRYLFKKKHSVMNCWPNLMLPPESSLGKVLNEQSNMYEIQNMKAAKDIISLGKNNRYLLMGPSIFTKKLIDTTPKISEENINILVFRESLPKDIEESFISKLKEPIIYSVYGASDIDSFIACETPFTKFLRKMCEKNRQLRLDLFGNPNKVPAIFQYNPMLFHMTNTRANGMKEFTITFLDEANNKPRIKYNPRDEGGTLNFNEALKRLKKHEANLKIKYKEHGNVDDILRLPLLFVFGRSDKSINIEGAIIQPRQIEIALYKNKNLFNKTNRIKVEKSFSKNHLIIHIELKRGVLKTNRLALAYEEAIFRELLFMNDKYRAAHSMNNNIEPKIELYYLNEGVFQ